MEELQLKQKSLKQDLQRLLDEKEDIVREKEEMNIKVPINKRIIVFPNNAAQKQTLNPGKSVKPVRTSIMT